MININLIYVQLIIYLFIYYFLRWNTKLSNTWHHKSESNELQSHQSESKKFNNLLMVYLWMLSAAQTVAVKWKTRWRKKSNTLNWSTMLALAEVTEESHNNLSQYSLCLSQDFNLGSLEYDGEVLIGQMWCLLGCIWRFYIITTPSKH